MNSRSSASVTFFSYILSIRVYHPNRNIRNARTQTDEIIEDSSPATAVVTSQHASTQTDPIDSHTEIDGPINEYIIVEEYEVKVKQNTPSVRPLQICRYHFSLKT